MMIKWVQENSMGFSLCAVLHNHYCCPAATLLDLVTCLSLITSSHTRAYALYHLHLLYIVNDVVAADFQLNSVAAVTAVRQYSRLCLT